MTQSGTWISLRNLATCLVMTTCSCAPQRATFSNPNFRSSPQPTSESSPISSPSLLQIHLAPEARTQLGELIQAIDANTSRLVVGNERVLRRLNQLTGGTDRRRQRITEVRDGAASYETSSVETGAVTFTGVLPLNESDSLERGIRALLEDRNEEIYRALHGMLSEMFSQAGDTLPEHPRVAIFFRHAERMADPRVFHLTIGCRVMGSRQPSLILDARIVRRG